MKHLFDMAEMRAVIVLILAVSVVGLTAFGIAPPETILRVFEASVMFFIGAKAVEKK